MSVSLTTIESDCGRFRLSDIHDDRNDLHQQPFLEILDSDQGEVLECWDNENYLAMLFESLEKDFHCSYYMELYETCTRYGFDIDTTQDTLVEMYQEAKKLKMFKSHN